MKNTIKLAAIHSNDAALWKEADPYNKEFDPAAPQKCVEHHIERTLGFLHEAGKSNVDLVCTHEDFKGTGLYLRYLDYPELFKSLAEEIPGPTSDRLGEIAALYNMHIAANYCERDGGEIYNTTVLIGRSGEIIGKYRKVHLPPSENWVVTAGKEFTVFETDIGRIGFATCYDIIFTEQCRIMALNGADIIIHQTQGWGILNNKAGEALVRTRALENSVYLVVAKNLQRGDGGVSCIIDNCGDILAKAQDGVEGLVTAEFEPNLDAVYEDRFDSFFAGVDSVRARIALQREPSLYAALTEKTPPLLERYRGVELHTSPDKVQRIFRRLREYEEDIENNRPVKIKYHW